MHTPPSIHGKAKCDSSAADGLSYYQSVVRVRGKGGSSVLTWQEVRLMR